VAIVPLQAFVDSFYRQVNLISLLFEPKRRYPISRRTTQLGR